MLHIQKPQQDITVQLEQGKILPLVFRLTIPAVIAQLITFLYNIVDRMYVARIDGSGMDALAALGIVLPITLIIQAFANSLDLAVLREPVSNWVKIIVRKPIAFLIRHFSCCWCLES